MIQSRLLASNLPPNSNAETLEIVQSALGLRSPDVNGNVEGWALKPIDFEMSTFQELLDPTGAETSNCQECEVTSKFHLRGEKFSFSRKERKPRAINIQEI